MHREDIINRRGCFARLRQAEARAKFDEDLLSLLRSAKFTIVGVVIDKQSLQHQYYSPAHPYHLGIGFLLQRYCGYLKCVGACGDVMAEGRGGNEDKALKSAYTTVYSSGLFKTKPEFFQRALTSKDIKIKKKTENIAGLQLADILGHPVKTAILLHYRKQERDSRASFSLKIIETVRTKFNSNVFTSVVENFGFVLFPK